MPPTSTLRLVVAMTRMLLPIRRNPWLVSAWLVTEPPDDGGCILSSTHNLCLWLLLGDHMLLGVPPMILMEEIIWDNRNNYFQHPQHWKRLSQQIWMWARRFGNNWIYLIILPTWSALYVGSKHHGGGNVPRVLGIILVLLLDRKLYQANLPLRIRKHQTQWHQCRKHWSWGAAICWV